MTTLVVSDLHLGARGERDVLRRRAPLAALVAALGGVSRLVLLGDVIELRQGPRREAMAAARGPLRAIGAALAPGTPVTLVPGNHDHMLLSPWLARRAETAAPPLGTHSRVDWRAPEPLAAVADWLAPAELEVLYPGCRLRDDVVALHGHYGDRHTTVPMLERLGAGVTARIAGEPPGGPRRAEDYEAALAPVYAWIDALAQTGGPQLGAGSDGASAHARSALTGPRRGLRRRALGAGFAAAVAIANRAGIGPLSADLSSPALRRAGLLAAGEVGLRLGVEARWLVFGHTHRAGPLTGDDAAQWRTITGARLINCGSWIDEPGFVGSDPARSPYRAGFAVTLDESDPVADPQLVNLLDGSAPDDLRGRWPAPG
ncbi:MAG: metallophosphoesterase [Solirubrobacteraceae bacterium]